MPREAREDVHAITGHRKTGAGFLQVDTAALTRSGVFQYSNADGSKRAEFRPEAEVFKADSMATLKGSPLTVGHQGVVSPANHRALSVGMVGEQVRRADVPRPPRRNH